MSNDIEKRLKGEQVHKTGPRGEALFCMTAVYQFILAVTAAAAFGDSWSGSSGCTGGRAAAASWIAPGCVVEAFPIAIAEAFPICLAPGARTDIMSAAAVAAGGFACHSDGQFGFIVFSLEYLIAEFPLLRILGNQAVPGGMNMYVNNHMYNLLLKF